MQYISQKRILAGYDEIIQLQELGILSDEMCGTMIKRVRQQVKDRHDEVWGNQE